MLLFEDNQIMLQTLQDILCVLTDCSRARSNIFCLTPSLSVTLSLNCEGVESLVRVEHSSWGRPLGPSAVRSTQWTTGSVISTLGPLQKEEGDFGGGNLSQRLVSGLIEGLGRDEAV